MGAYAEHDSIGNQGFERDAHREKNDPLSQVMQSSLALGLPHRGH